MLLKRPGRIQSVFQVWFGNIEASLKHFPCPAFWTGIWANFDAVQMMQTQMALKRH